MPLSTCKLVHVMYIVYSVSFSYYVCFLLFVSKSNMKFCQKNFLSPIFPMTTSRGNKLNLNLISGHGTERVLLMKKKKFEILGLVSDFSCTCVVLSVNEVCQKPSKI